MVNRTTRTSKSLTQAKVAKGEADVKRAVILAGVQEGVRPMDRLDQLAEASVALAQVEEVVAELPELAPEVQVEQLVPLAEEIKALEARLFPETSAPEAAPAAPQAATGPILQVKLGLTLRGGRGEWYKMLCEYNGRPVAEYVAHGKANPASHYTARSTKCGQPKTPESRLSWFKRAGIVTLK